MRLPGVVALVWVSVAFLPMSAPARASTAWPERGSALSNADLIALRADGLGEITGPDGIPRFVIDDQHFRQDEVRLAGFSARPWTKGRLIYTFSRYVSQSNRQRFLAACAEWTRVANVRCIPRTNQSVYLFVRNSDGNSADVGMPRSGVAYLKMYNWTWKFIIAHEIGHALGLSHEQCRTGRGEFVRILWGNLRPGTKRVNFNEHSTTNLTPYDFRSVMHYDDKAFGKRLAGGGRLTTIRVLPPNQRFQTVIGQRSGLSAPDGAGMAARYGPPRARSTAT
jgi:hypothetical protein